MKCRSRFVRQLPGLALLAAALLAGSAAGADEPADAARAQLTALDLAPLGKSWIVSTERELRRDLDGLDPLVRRYRQAAEAARQMQARNRSLRAALKNQPAGGPAAEALKRLSPPRGSAAGSALAPKGIAANAKDVTGVGDGTPLQEAQIELASARTELVLAVLGIRRSLERVQAQYQQLEERPDVPPLLQQVGGGAKLGPAKQYARDPRLASAAAAGLGSPLPIYRESGRLWASLVVNEVAAVAFEINLEDDATWITANSAQALGLEDLDRQPALEIKLAARRISARKIELASIRLGRQTMRKVSAYVLAPEAEDVGARLGAAAFGLARPRLNETDWLLEWEPTSGEGR